MWVGLARTLSRRDCTLGANKIKGLVEEVNGECKTNQNYDS